MKILTKSPVQAVLVMLAVSSALFAQTGERTPPRTSNDASVLDTRHIVELSVAATERNWDARNDYTYTERDADRRLDSTGQLKSENIDITRMIVVKGARFAQLVEHNGSPPSAEKQRSSGEDLDRLEHETPAERTIRLGKTKENESFLGEVVNAFDFQLIGEESAEGRPAYIFHVTPHPGYHAHGKYGKMLSKVEGNIWIDKEDFGWIKIDGQVTQSFSVGFFIARVQQGSRIMLEQTRVSDGVWMPKHIEMRASARILFLKSLDIDRILTYSDYDRVTDGPYSASQ